MNNNKKIIFTLVGQLACGKGTVAKYIEKKYQGSSYRFSSVFRDILDRLHVEVSRHSQQKLSTLLREHFGEDILAKVIAEDVENDDRKIIAVDGVRRFADIKYLKELGGFRLVKIEADAKIRYQRLVERTENNGDANKSYEDFLEDQKKEADAEIPDVMNSTELSINNDGTIEELYKQIDNLVIDY